MELKGEELADPYELIEHLMMDAMLSLPKAVRESYFTPELIGPLADFGRCTLNAPPRDRFPARTADAER